MFTISSRLLTRLAVAALLTAAAGCSHPADFDPPAPDGLAERFELIAFHEEFSGSEISLHRWDRDSIRITPLGETGDVYRPAIATVTDELSELTGRRIRLVSSRQQGEIGILIDTSESIRRHLQAVPTFRPHAGIMARATCAALFFPESPQTPETIVGAVITINQAFGEELILGCIAQEITQVLGLPNDIDDPDGTVFSSRSTRTTLSESDRNIVRILYDPRLRPGMTRAEAMPIVRRIAAELEAQQEATR